MKNRSRGKRKNLFPWAVH